MTPHSMRLLLFSEPHLWVKVCLFCWQNPPRSPANRKDRGRTRWGWPALSACWLIDSRRIKCMRWAGELKAPLLTADMLFYSLTVSRFWVWSQMCGALLSELAAYTCENLLSKICRSPPFWSHAPLSYMRLYKMPCCVQYPENSSILCFIGVK